MYLRKVNLKNLKGFSDLELDLRDEGGARLGSAVVGAAEMGKTTLLQAVAATLAGPDAAPALLPPTAGWVRSGLPFGEIRAELLETEGDAALRKWPKKTSPYVARYLVRGGDPQEIVEWPGGGPRRQRRRAVEDMARLRRTAYAEGAPGWFACGYGPGGAAAASAEAERDGAFRRKAARFLTLFRRDAWLPDSTGWLAGLERAAEAGDPAARAILDRLQAAEWRAATGGAATGGRPYAADGMDRAAMGGRPYAVDGAGRLLRLGLDLARRLAEAFPEAADPLAQRGVVLIDDFDTLCGDLPQREAGSWLRRTFPRAQFIVASERPISGPPENGWTNVFLRHAADAPGLPAVIGQAEKRAPARAGERAGQPRPPRIICAPS